MRGEVLCLESRHQCSYNSILILSCTLPLTVQPRGASQPPTQERLLYHRVPHFSERQLGSNASGTHTVSRPDAIIEHN
jgi:hypothetical protein